MTTTINHRPSSSVLENGQPGGQPGSDDLTTEVLEAMKVLSTDLAKTLLTGAEWNQLDFALRVERVSDAGRRHAIRRLGQVNLAEQVLLLDEAGVTSDWWHNLTDLEQEMIQVFPLAPDGAAWEQVVRPVLRNLRIWTEEEARRPASSEADRRGSSAKARARKARKAEADRQLRAEMRGSSGRGSKKGK